MHRFLFSILFLTFTFCAMTRSAAQDSKQSNGGPTFAVRKLSDSKSKIGDGQGKAVDSRGDYQNAPDSPIAAGSRVVAVADSVNLPKETILGMDPTIALFLVFGIFLVLVVAIVASSKGGRSHD